MRIPRIVRRNQRSVISLQEDFPLDDYEDLPIQEFIDSGLMALVNTSILWPRGLSLYATDDGCGFERLDVCDIGSPITGDPDLVARRAGAFPEWDAIRQEKMRAEIDAIRGKR